MNKILERKRKAERKREHERGVRALGHRLADKFAKTSHLPSAGVGGFYGVMMRRRERGTASLAPRADNTMPAFSLRYKAKVMGCSFSDWQRHWAFMRESFAPNVLAHYGLDYDDTPFADARPDWGVDVPGIDYSYRRE